MKTKKERASWPMKDWEVRVIRDGSKTQHRIPVKLPHQNPLGAWEPFLWGGMDGGKTRDGLTMPEEMTISHTRTGEIIGCPHGQPGDRLWVREAFVQGLPYDATTDRLMQWDTEGNEIPKKTWYRADGADIGWADDDGWQTNTPWRPSIQMPRSASRITLEIVSVRVDRLQDISEADAVAEGCTKNQNGYYWGGLHNVSGRKQFPTPIQAYQDIWTQRHGVDSWGANDWVWVLEFKVV